MRRLLTFAVLAALVLPAAAIARQRGPSDGTLSVKEVHGMVTIQGRGAVIGSFAQGRVTISDPIDGDGTGPIVTGDDWSKDRNDTTTTWGGTKGAGHQPLVRGEGKRDLQRGRHGRRRRICGERRGLQSDPRLPLHVPAVRHESESLTSPHEQ